MSQVNTQLLTLFASTGAGIWMAYAGVQKSVLEWRRRRRSCPSCGRALHGRTCGCV
jgi:hypothetical protein